MLQMVTEGLYLPSTGFSSLKLDSGHFLLNNHQVLLPLMSGQRLFPEEGIHGCVRVKVECVFVRMGKMGVGGGGTMLVVIFCIK